MRYLSLTWLLEGLKRSIVTYTRLPIRIAWQTEKKAAQPAAFLPFIGALIGVLSSWPIFIPVFDLSLMALLMLLTAVLLTGAFHEDGFMDSLDGLVGGMDAKQRLTIMKDSRLGSYASIGIWFLLAFKWLLLTKLLVLFDSRYLLIISWIFVHVFARMTPLFIMRFLPYVSLGNSKAINMIGRFNLVEWCIVFLPAFFLILLNYFIDFFWYSGIFLFVLVACLSLFFGLYLRSKIAGFNGDTLGASEQLSEAVLLLAMVMFFTDTVSTLNV